MWSPPPTPHPNSQGPMGGGGGGSKVQGTSPTTPLNLRGVVGLDLSRSRSSHPKGKSPFFFIIIFF